MNRKFLKALALVIIFIESIYPILYFFSGNRFGLRGLKNDETLYDPVWNIAFYIHITCGGVALLAGILPLIQRIRLKNITLHRKSGQVYVLFTLLSSVAGIYMGFFATGGLISSLGFISLGVLWLTVTTFAYLAIKNHNILLHQRLMIYSYAACLAGVSLRIWLPLLIILLNDFTIAYRIVAWLSWVPNILIAFILTKNTQQ